MVSKLACFTLFLFSIVSVQSQVRISASVTPHEIAKNQLAEYRLTIENTTDIRDIKTPMFRNFNVLGGPSRESGVSTINGHVTRYTSWIFTLRPQKSGTFRIEPTSAILDGKEHKTEPVTIIVKNITLPNSPSTYQPYNPYEAPHPTADMEDFIIRKGVDPDVQAKKNLSLTVDVSKKECFVGEPIVASYQLLSRLRSESRITKSPSFNGFSVIDLPEQENISPNTRKVNGREYNVYVLRKAQLYPLQPGIVDIDPAEVENDVQFIREEYIKTQSSDISDWLENGISSLLPPDAILNTKVAVRNEPVKITVKPLPEEGKPACFDGAVGEFTIQAALDKDQFAANESAKLVVVVKGKGNIQLLTAPDIRWPSDIDVYEPEYREDLYKAAVPVNGVKVFIYPFSVSSPGQFTIPEICFSYFDPSSGKYHLIKTSPMTFSVGPASGNGPSGESTTDANSQVSFINRIFHHRWWMVVILATLILSGLFLWVWREKKAGDNKNATTEDIQPATPEVPEPTVDVDSPQVWTDPLHETAQMLNQDVSKGFYQMLNKELRMYLSTLTGVEANLISHAVVAEYADKNGIVHSVTLRLQELMRQIEQHLYTPFDNTGRQRELYDEASAIIMILKQHGFNRR